MKKLSFLLIFALIFALSCTSTSAPASEEEPADTAARAEVKEAEPKDDLWVLSVGINEYKDNYFPNLLFAVNDAKTISEAFKKQEGLVFGTVNTMLITDSDELTPTKENILAGLEFLQDAKPEDTVVLFFALHRLIHQDGFYLMTSDSKYESQEEDGTSTLINFQEIIDGLDFPAKKIIILDTHFPKDSVNIDEDSHLAIFSACSENEQARESSLFGGGFFTASILEAFKLASTGSNEMTLSDLFDYVSGRVAELTENKQNPVLNAHGEMEELVLGFRK
ncbi:MAG: caspase family protein [Treponema sp.]|nr:caspase family protein [Treponema sp.]